MIEVGLTELGAIATVLLGCIGALWKIITDYRKKEEARYIETEKEFKELNAKHQDVRVDLARVQGQVEGSNKLALKVLEKIEELAGDKNS